MLSGIHAQRFDVPQQRESLFELCLDSTYVILALKQYVEQGRLRVRLRLFGQRLDLPGWEAHDLGRIVESDVAFAFLVEQQHLFDRKCFDRLFGETAFDQPPPGGCDLGRVL